MLWEIMRKEILGNITSPKFVFSFLLCTILIVLSVYSGAINYSEELSEYNTAVSLNQRNLDNLKDYNSVYSNGIKIIKPPEVLSTITTGINDAVGRRTSVNSWTIPTLSDSKYSGNSSSAIFGELDLILIVKIVLSLFAILFTYNAISGEKERGTLKSIIANNISRDRIIFGKFLGCSISLLFPLIIPILMGLILLVIYPDISFSQEEWIRIAFVFVLFFLYLLVFVTLGLFISSLTSRSSYSLFILLFLWIMFLIVVPKASVMTANQIKPIPSMHEVTAQKNAFHEELNKYQMKILHEMFEETKGLSQEERKKSSTEFYKKLYNGLNTMRDKRYAEIDEEYRSKRRGQQILAMNLSRISPASALTFSAASIGRTGIDEHEHFERSVKAYKPLFLKWSIDNLWDNSPINVKPDLSDMPQFEFKPESLKASIARALPDILIMVLLIIVFFAGAFVSFLRYDVR